MRMYVLCAMIGLGGAGRATAQAISIHEEMDLVASPARVYEALLDTKQFTALTASLGAGSAMIDRAVGGAFSLFGGQIVGRNLELIQNKRIVQAWRAMDWPDGVHSIVRFELTARGTGTHLVFDHTGFPEGQHDHLVHGWEVHYWAPLKAYLR
jgi:activator of HSP90 ATPase